MFSPPSRANEQHRSTWTQTIIPSGSEISHHASVLSQGHIITFGGRNAVDPGSKFMIAFNLAKQCNVPHVFRGEFPDIQGHTMCIDQNDNIIVYGGKSGPFKTLSKLETLRMEVQEEQVVFSCQEIQTVGNAPVLAHHTANIYQNKMYIFGGCSTHSFRFNVYNDVWEINFDTLKWEKCSTIGDLPRARWSHTSSLYRGKLYIYGGAGAKNEDIFDDLFMLNLENMEWKLVETKGIGPGLRLAASMQGFREKLFLFGGTDDKSAQKLYNDLYTFCTQTNTWTQIQTFQPPPERFGHSSVVCGSKLYILGGSNPLKTFNFDIWSLDLESIAGPEPGTDKKESAGEKFLKIENEPFCLIELFTQKSFTDIVLEAEGKEFLAHKAILSQRCGMSDSNLSRLSISDAKADTFEVMLRFIYSDPNLTVDEDMAFELLGLSDKYLLPTLKAQCEKVLNKLLTLENFTKIAKAAEMVESDVIKEVVFKFARQNINILKERGDFYNLSQSFLIELFASIVVSK